ncbi:MAG: alpha/beta hydrolase family protein [Acidimicrobiia bacterium]|nr:alpha/beta hydrolase family protein [Acidimicrobiia bacterium]
MHWLDRLAGILTARSRFYDRVFADGWGDASTLRELRAGARRVGDIPRIEISWDSAFERRGILHTDGWFESPSAGILPEASRIARLRRVEPRDGTKAVCLMMAAFNDHGFETRHKLAVRLTDHGIASLILENPYYGTRRPSTGQPLRTVVDFYAMGAAAVLEGRAILAGIRAVDPIPIGVAGYSMGGNIAALVSATVPFPIATAGLAASHSPGPVWTEGLLATAIAWDALGGVGKKDDIATALGSASALHFPAPPHAASAVLAAPLADGYIPRHAFEALHGHWPGSELRWIKGGHASVLLWHKKELAQAIVDSFERLRCSSEL